MSGKKTRPDIYPLLFKPVYKSIVWGGNMLAEKLGRKVPEGPAPVAESWEIVDREDAQSVVENGPLKGAKLEDLVKDFGQVFVGRRFKDGRFPLLVKLIDAGKRLSLQVHPDESAARKDPGAEPKTEMWYVIAAKPDAKIFAGIRSRCTKVKFVNSVNSNDIESCLQKFRSIPGDAYFITSGTVHAIGAGNLLLEVQQNSDTTYRISDWGRLGSDGKARELHVKEALDSIHFTNRTVPRISGATDIADRNRKFPIINRCPYFHVQDLRLVEEWRDQVTKESFHILTAVNTGVRVLKDDAVTFIDRGRSCLIPAGFGDYSILPEDKSESIVVQTNL